MPNSASNSLLRRILPSVLVVAKNEQRHKKVTSAPLSRYRAIDVSRDAKGELLAPLEASMATASKGDTFGISFAIYG